MSVWCKVEACRPSFFNLGTRGPYLRCRRPLGDIGGYIELLKGLKAGVDDNTIPAINWKEIRPFLAMEHFTVEIIQSKNSAAAGVCSFVLNIVMVRQVARG